MSRDLLITVSKCAKPVQMSVRNTSTSIAKIAQKPAGNVQRPAELCSIRNKLTPEPRGFLMKIISIKYIARKIKTYSALKLKVCARVVYLNFD
jgi:hypothetical protein